MFGQQKHKFVKRRFAHVLSASGAQLMFELRRCLKDLQDDPILCGHADDLKREALELLQRFRTVDDATCAKLESLRAKLEKSAPEAHDEPLPPDADLHLASLKNRYDNFAKLASSESKVTFGELKDNQTRTVRLLTLLRGKVQQARWPVVKLEGNQVRESESDLRPDLESIALEIGEIDEHFSFAFSEFVIEQSASPGVSFLQLVSEVDGMNPEPPKWNDESQDKRLNRWMMNLVNGARGFRKALYGEGDEKELQQFEAHVTQLRAPIRRVSEELQIRVLGQRSVRALLERYKARCELPIFRT